MSLPVEVYLRHTDIFVMHLMRKTEYLPDAEPRIRAKFDSTIQISINRASAIPDEHKHTAHIYLYHLLKICKTKSSKVMSWEK